MIPRRLVITAVSLVVLPLALTACGNAEATRSAAATPSATPSSSSSASPSATGQAPAPADQQTGKEGGKQDGQQSQSAKVPALRPVTVSDLRKISTEGVWRSVQPVDNPDRGDYSCQDRHLRDFSPVRNTLYALDNPSVGVVKQDLASFRTTDAARTAAQALINDISVCSPRPKGVKIHRDAALGESVAWSLITPLDDEEGTFDYVGIGVKGRAVTVVVLSHVGQDSNYDPAPSATLLKAALARL